MAQLAPMAATRYETMLHDLIARGGVRRLYWATGTAHPGRGNVVSMGGDYSRILLGLSGRRHVRFMRAQEATEVAIKAGDCLVMAPHCWLVTEHREPFLSLAVALEPRNPRLVLARDVRPSTSSGSKQPLVPSAEVEIFPRLCDSTSMALAGALLAAQASDGRELLVRRLAEALWLTISAHTRQASEITIGKARHTFGAAEHFVREHFARPIDRAEVARDLRIHPSHVTRLFLRFAGETFGGFLLRVRLESARTLLRDPRHSVSEVAYLTGFTSVNYFVRAYRVRFGITPARDRGNQSGATPLDREAREERAESATS